MNTAIQDTNTKLNKIHSTETTDFSFHKSLFTLWMDLENSLEIATTGQSTSASYTAETDRNLDEIIDAQDHVAIAACQSQANSFEGLLYKLAMWRSDTPDFETMPINADRKDRIVYSVFRDLIKLTGIDEVKTNADNKTQFLGLEHP